MGKNAVRQRLAQASDEEILQLIRANDRQAFAELWRRYHTAAMRFARSHTRFDADDVVAEAFTRTFAQILAGRGPKENVRAYLFTSIRNISTLWARTKPDLELSESHNLVHEDESIEHRIDRVSVVDVFKGLPIRWQEVLWMNEVEGLPNSEIGRRLGVSENAVSALTFRARDGLRRAWLTSQITTETANLDCRWVRSKLAMKPGSLRPAERARMRDHLDSCEPCQEVADETRRLGLKLAVALLPIIAIPTGIGVVRAKPEAQLSASGLRPVVRSRTTSLLKSAAAVAIFGSILAVGAARPETVIAAPESAQTTSASPTSAAVPTSAPNASPSAIPPHTVDDSAESVISGASTTTNKTPGLSIARIDVSDEDVLMVSGIGHPGRSVSVRVPSLELIHTTVAADGSWSARGDLSTLSDGDYLLDVVSGSESSQQVLAFRRFVPAEAQIDFLDTSEGRYYPVVGGSAPAGRTVFIYLDGGHEPVASTTADSSGAWTTDPIVIDTPGTHYLTAHVEGSPGRTSSSPASFTLDPPVHQAITADGSGMVFTGIPFASMLVEGFTAGGIVDFPASGEVALTWLQDTTVRDDCGRARYIDPSGERMGPWSKTCTSGVPL